MLLSVAENKYIHKTNISWPDDQYGIKNKNRKTWFSEAPDNLKLKSKVY